MEKKSGISINYVYPVIIFFFISLAYFVPDSVQGRKLYQSDIMQYKGMSKEISDHREAFGEEPLWTNSMFGGMPAYLISTQYKSNILRQVHRIFTLFNFRPVCFIFLYLLGFYIALLLFDIKPWISFAGAIAYAFSSYFFIIIVAGHVSKVLALGYMPPIIAGVYVAFRGKPLIGSMVTGIFLGLQIVVNHLQITYYTLLIILIFIIFELTRLARHHNYREFFRPVPWLFAFGILAVGLNFSTLWTTYEYGKYSIRGKSELTLNAENQTSGLDKDYATQWSYGIGETFTLLIPNFMGGSSSGELKTNSETYDYIRNNYSAGDAGSFIKNVWLYRGSQPSTQGPVYVGATVVFLFVLGMFILKGPVKWWLFTVTVVSIVLSWGRNFPALTNFMLDYFPGYNKFRTVSMILIMAQFAMPMLAILTIREILENDLARKEFMKKWKYALYGAGGILILILIFAGSFDFSAPVDEQMRSQGLDPMIIDAIRNDRLALLRMDAFRSLVFVLLTASAVLAIFLKKIKIQTAIAALSLLFLVDMWPVNKRYLNSDDFVSKREDLNLFTPTTADQIILQDRDQDFRVLNLTVSTFQDASTSYFHKSIGGYHGAKMQRYQELIDHHIINEMSALINTFQTSPTTAALDSVMSDMHALNMLNTRYIIYSGEAPPLVNKHELGNAWFVNSYKLVNNADEEIAALSDIDPSTEALIDARYEPEIQNLNLKPDSTATIRITEYRANYLKYTTSSSSEQLAVFSEIYYDKGWQAYIDEKPASHIRANYVLRAMRIPEGNHTIEFKFQPESYFTGEKISLASSIFLLLMIAGTGWYSRNKNRKAIDDDQ
ncbi:MAG: YfhO family protein [Bacteroidales bacterium]|nr:YfhO family protein [Bacteroidales bacterium]